MIDELDATLHELLEREVPALQDTSTTIATDQIAFQPPDDTWRSYVTGSLKRRALNVYLVDVHENAKLRTNERVRVYDNGIVADELAPVRLDCHYLVTAWSPATETAGKTAEEHELLYEAARALLAHRPLVPLDVWGGMLPATVPTLPGDAQLPVSVAPPEGYSHLSYFWSAMGTDPRWRPALSLVVTLPVLLPRFDYGPPVTTALAEVGVNGGTAVDQFVAIGGRVLDATGIGDPVAVAGAWVAVETTAGHRIDTTETDADGRFRLGGLSTGTYALRALATGLGSIQRSPVDVPSPTGEYDLRFV
jgi:hypothetical protein